MSRQLNIFSPRQLFRQHGGEALLQFIWQHQYFNKENLGTITGERLLVEYPGMLNTDQGPDFKDARIRIGNTLFAGSVEVHIQTSDWNRHEHEGDLHYNNVVLHVVFHHDEMVNQVPVLQLEPHIAVSLLEKYQQLMEAGQEFIPCGQQIATVNVMVLRSWLERMLVERLEVKSGRVVQLLEAANRHWEEAFWWLLARNFGVQANSDAFERIAQSIPLLLLARHKNQLVQLEAVLMGQAGLLQGDFEDAYAQLLQREYQFLRHKWQLKPTPVQLAFSRMRPGNFPTIRLAQLAALVHQSSHLFSRMVEANELSEIRGLLSVTANDYWHYRYQFDKPSSFRPKKLGGSMVDNVIINTIIPVLFAHGRDISSPALCDKALRWMQEVNAEYNHVSRGFEGLGLRAKSAFDTQAMVHLEKAYCRKKFCLKCAVGNALLRRS